MRKTDSFLGIQGVKDMISIVVADDHKIVREGLIRLLEAREDFSVIGEASNGKKPSPW